MRICVIGAGVSGLVSAKVLKHDGFEVTIYEKEPAVGGVWASWGRLGPSDHRLAAGS